MISFKEHLKEEIINEVFDSPHAIKNGEDDMMGFMMKTSAELRGAKNVNIYNVGDTGDKIATWHHNDAMEIHHLPASGMQGVIDPHATKPNPKFISTALKLGKDHIDSGGKVRIVTTEDLLPHFKPLGEKVSKRLGYNMAVSPIHDTSFYSPFPVKLHAIDISKNIDH